VTDEEAASGDLIEYRTLTRADFQGPAPTGSAAQHVDKIGALTHALIKHDPGVGFAGKQITSPNGDQRVEGKVQNLRFRAWMDRSRSWWNPKPGMAPESYVLEHEQIHFAIVEIEARKMNAEGAALMKKTFKGSAAEAIQKTAWRACSNAAPTSTRTRPPATTRKSRMNGGSACSASSPPVGADLVPKVPAFGVSRGNSRALAAAGRRGD
jgi:hypothetical protein